MQRWMMILILSWGGLLGGRGVHAAEALVGDLNGDLRVDMKDLALLAQHWLEDNQPPVLVRWYGHTTWKIWQDNVIIYIDPVGLTGALPDATLVLVSHTHSDHYSSTDINRISGPNTVFLGSADAVRQQGWGTAMLPGETYTMEGIRITGVPAYNIDKTNHPRSNNWLGFIIEFGGLRFYYGGDTDVTPEMQALQDIDVAIIPIGGTYTMDAVEAAAATYDFKPALSLPSHWGRIVGTSADARYFAEHAYGEVIVLDEGQSLNLKEHYPVEPLLAHWSLDETSGDLAFDPAGAHTGRLLGNASWHAGLLDGAVSLDGTDDRIETDFVLNPGAGPFTAMAWVQGGGPHQVILAQTGSKGKDWLATDENGYGRVDLGTSGRGGHSLIGDLALTDGLWHHVALMWDGSLRRLYVDGESHGVDDSGVTLENINSSMVIGPNWQGLIDDIRIYGAALTPAEMMVQASGL